MDTGELQSRLIDFCREQTGDTHAAVSNIEVLPGHAGFSWGFTLTSTAEGHGDGRTAPCPDRLVLRLPPPGVRWVGTADVLRQARVMRALAGTPVPVPPVRWAGDDLRWFGRPYVIVERLPGDTIRLMHLAGERPPDYDARTLHAVAEQVTAALAALHRIEWRTALPDWGPPPSLDDEVTRWDWLLERNADPGRTSLPALTAAAPAVRGRLRARLPAPPRAGIIHGDYQWSNHLVDGGRLTAVLDWELTGVGATPMDLGWLAVFSDPESWVGNARYTGPLPGPDAIIAMYEAALGEPVQEPNWYRALAGYKFALITGLNLSLHRRGKRPDPLWEEIAPSAPRLLARALELLA